MDERFIKYGYDLNRLGADSILSDSIIAKMENLGYAPSFGENLAEFTKNGKRIFIEYDANSQCYFSGIRQNGREENVKKAIYHEVVEHMLDLGKKNRYSGLADRLKSILMG